MKPVKIIESQTHLPTWQREHRGLFWWNMPSGDSDTKKLNFCLFVRGLYDPDLEPVSDEDSGLDEVGLAKAKRDSQGRVLKRAGRKCYGTLSGRLAPKVAETLAAKASAEAGMKAEREKTQQELLARYVAAKKQGGFVRAIYDVDPTAHSAVARAMGSGRGCKGPLRMVSLDRIERAFAKLNSEGWMV